MHPQETCKLPVRYDDMPVEGCVVFNSSSQCWSVGGDWIPCGPGAPGAAGLVSGPVTQLKDVQRVTTDNNVCDLPFFFQVSAWRGHALNLGLRAECVGFRAWDNNAC